MNKYKVFLMSFISISTLYFSMPVAGGSHINSITASKHINSYYLAELPAQKENNQINQTAFTNNNCDPKMIIYPSADCDQDMIINVNPDIDSNFIIKAYLDEK